jgi:hypothetical membrane protein
MLSNQIYSEKTIALEELFPNFTHEFLEPFKSIVGDEVRPDLHLDFSIAGRKHKINPILRLARVEDAEELVEVYKELYDGTYPYKEMEDVHEVRKMITNPNIRWIIFQDPHLTLAGCITFVLDFQNRRGYIRGFMLRKQYQGYIDITKAMISSMLGMLHKFKDSIYVWYVENRTAHAKSQYSMNVCGIAPIAFYPNKDVFCGEIESDIMQILYDERALKTLRSKKIPELIPAVESIFYYSQERYGLKTPEFMVSEMTLEKKKVKNLKKLRGRKVEKDKFGYETTTLTLDNSDSFFEFVYTPLVQNIEKIKYKVADLEELYIFVQELLRCKKELAVRYCEVFVSAYKRDHQQIFFDAGFKPRGYIPSWKYSNKNSVFKDSVLFSIFDGTINNKIQLIEQGYKLVEILGIEFGFSEVQEKRVIPKKIILPLFKPKKLIKRSLLTAMGAYLSLLFISLFVALNLGAAGFDITKHTISDLGNSLFTPAPFLFDTACGFAGAITIPYSFYIYNGMKKADYMIISRIGNICGVIGGFGYICVGIFSLERSGPNGSIHMVSAIIAFIGFVFSILFFSIPALLHQNRVYKLFGLSGVFMPLLMLLLNCFIASSLLEWSLLFSILLHICPLNYWSISK